MVNGEENLITSLLFASIVIGGFSLLKLVLKLDAF